MKCARQGGSPCRARISGQSSLTVEPRETRSVRTRDYRLLETEDLRDRIQARCPSDQPDRRAHRALREMISRERAVSEFEALTGEGVVVNTSFNVRGEPIVCSPEDAYRCFMRTDMDTLVVENFILRKTDQPEFSDTDWREEYELD